MKIVLLADSISNQQAGIHYYGKQLIKSLVKQKPEHQYYVVSSKRLGFDNTVDIVVPLNHKIPFSIRIRQIFTLPRIIENLNPDIVIELAHFGPFRLSKKIKRVTVIHDLTPVTHPQFHDKLSVFFHKLLLPRIIRKAEWIICNSNFTKSELINYYKNVSNKIRVVYPEIPDYSQIDLPLNDEDQHPYFVSIGTIEPRKNYQSLLLAFEKYKLNGGENKLKLIGPKGWLNKDFHTTLKAMQFNRDVVIKNSIPRSELITILSRARAFISASWVEGFGIPVVEAMAFSKPLILSDIKVYKEIAEGAAIYFDPNDIDSISDALSKSEVQEVALIAKSKEQHKKLLKTQRDFSFVS